MKQPLKYWQHVKDHKDIKYYAYQYGQSAEVAL